MVQESKVSFEYVDFHAKMSLIFYPAYGKADTSRDIGGSQQISDRLLNSLFSELHLLDTLYGTL